jgi:hypothetical protein
MKIGGTIFASCILFIMLCLRRKGLDETTFRIRISRLSLARHRPTLPVLARQVQSGTYVYLRLTGWRRLFDSEVHERNLG